MTNKMLSKSILFLRMIPETFSHIYQIVNNPAKIKEIIGIINGIKGLYDFVNYLKINEKLLVVRNRYQIVLSSEKQVII